MKARFLLSLFGTLVLSLSGWAAADATSGFTTLKSLAGQWEAKGETGEPHITTWKIISGGSAVMEEMPHESMVTMFHLDKNRLLMTHYCSANNQPRMQAEFSPDGKTITFNLLDVTNLAKPSDGHMQKMVLTVIDPDHFAERWTFRQDGKDNTHTLEYTRKK
ncbi:MAG TPA: hypothetical protein VHN74_12460 [Candidatus Angelobacter sp.]|jgi:hypothetical protein|nr:hypothetical protein [Candidatus Angelobacter sp.]